MSKKLIDMTTGNPTKLIFRFSLPLMVGNIFQQCYTIVDAIVVGQGVGVDALAAVGSTGSLNFLIIGFCMGVCNGFAIPLAHKFGAGDYSGMRAFMMNAVYLSVVFSVVMTVFTVAFCRPILELMQTPHLAWHLSGGTTELLLVTPDGKNVRAEKLGGTSDISAGQLIDRTGKLLGLPFPAGKSIDALSRESDSKERYRVKLSGLEFSFSGIQNKTEKFYSETKNAADTAKFVMNCVVTCIADATRAALAQYPGLPVVFSGGVASNSMLRERMREFAPVFAEPQFSTDNAMGIAVLTALQEGT